MRPLILIHCQYVYGIGHFVRAVELARSLRGDFNVHLVSGGEPVPNFTLPEGIAFTQLPPIFKDEMSGQLRSVDPAIDLTTCLAKRADMLAQLVQDRTPGIVITEHFPFGLLFEAEVIGMLSRVRRLRPDAMVVSSVRDVIESAKGGKDDPRICELIDQWFDLIVVHGDARVLPLRASFPLIDRIKTPYVHTGYVVEPAQPRRERAGLPLLVGAIGGGRMGQELLAALAASHREVCASWPHELLLFRGAFEHDTTAPGAAQGQVRIQPFDRKAYRQALAESAGLISLGGYNSVLEALSMALPVLIYKRHFLGANREQALRADFFRQSKLVMTLEEHDLATRVLARRIVSHFATPPERSPVLDFQGSANTARILLARWHVTRKQRIISR